MLVVIFLITGVYDRRLLTLFVGISMFSKETGSLVDADLALQDQA